MKKVLEVLNKVFRFLPPTFSYALLISIIVGIVLSLFQIATFSAGFVLTLIAYYLCVTIFVFGRQGYWFIFKKGDYNK